MVKNGKGNTTITELLYVDTYTVKLSADIAGHNPFLDETASFAVTPATVGLTIEIKNVTYPNKAVAKVSANASGIYNITVDGHVYSVNIQTAPGTFKSAECTLDVLAVKTHTATVEKVNVDGNFTSSAQNQTDFTVNKGTPVIIINVKDSYDALSNVTVNVTVPYGTGKVQVLDGANPIGGAVDLVNSTALLTIPNIKGIGIHTIFVQLSGDNNLTNNYNFTTFEVNKAATGFNITDNKAVYEDEVVITVKITGLVNGTLPRGQITIGDEIKDATNETITVNLGKLAAGNYTINVTYTGDPTDENTVYAGCSEEYKFTVEKFTPSVYAHGVDAVYPNLPAVEFSSNRTGNFTIYIIDSEGIVVQTIDWGILKNDTGAGAHIENLTVGKYTANVTFIGNDNYTSVTNTTEFNVLPGEVTFNVNVTGGAYPVKAVVDILASEDGIYNLTVFDNNGTIVFNQTGSLIGGNITTVELNTLNAGTYTVNVTYENGNFTVEPVQKEFTIFKNVPQIVIAVTDATYPQKGIVNVTCSADGEYTLTVGSFNATGNFIANVTQRFTLDTLAADTYDIMLVYAENDNYNKTTATGKLIVSKATPAINITVNTEKIFENATLTVKIPYATGNMISVNGIDVKLINGTATYNIGILAAQTYTFTAVYDGDDNVSFGSATKIFTVAKLPSNLSVSVKNTTYSINPEVVIALDNKEDADVDLYVDGVYSKTVKVSKGKYTGDISDLHAGNHNLTVAYKGSDVYEADTQTAYFKVDKVNATLSVNAVGGTYPDPISVTVKADVSGEYNLTFGTSTQVVTLEAGVAKQITYSNLAAGTYIVTLYHVESNDFNPVSLSSDATLEKANVTVGVSASGVTYPGDVIVSVESNVDGKYTVTVGSTTQSVTLKAGIPKEIAFSNIAAGSHVVTAAYGETENYTAASATTNVKVVKATSSVVITPVSGTVTYPGAVDISYSESNGVAVVSVKDASGASVEASVSGGVISLTGLAAGNYTVSAVIADTANVTGSSDEITFSVAKVENTTITVEATSPSAGENATVSVTLPADATGTVDVKYNDKTYSAPVVNGTATVSVPTNAAGTSTATVTYSGDDNYASASKDINITTKGNGKIIAKDIRRGVNSSYDYLATLVDDAGNPISGVEITFTIDGKVYKATTNASGIATVSALTVSNYAETVYNVVVTNPFTGENSTATTTIVPRLVVLSGDLTAGYLENPPFVVQAFGDDGNPVGAGEIVRFTLNGKTYDIATNESGIAVRTIGLAPGQYGIYAVYEGYKTQQVVLKVQKTISVASGTIKKTAKSYTFKATLKSTKGASVSGKTITFKFNGKKYTATTNSKGVAQYTIKSSVIKKLKTGTYKVAAVYVSEVAKANIKVK